MQETPLNKAFEKAMHALEADRFQKDVMRQLSTLQAVAREFQESNMPVTLQVRPGYEGCTLTSDDHDNLREDDVLANGVLSVDGIKLDVVLQKGEDEYEPRLELKIFRGAETLLERASIYDEEKKIWEDEEPEDRDDRYHDDDAETPAPKMTVREAVTALLIDLRVRKAFASRYDVDPGAGMGSSIEKPVVLGPVLQIKKQGKAP